MSLLASIRNRKLTGVLESMNSEWEETMVVAWRGLVARMEDGAVAIAGRSRNRRSRRFGLQRREDVIRPGSPDL